MSADDRCPFCLGERFPDGCGPTWVEWVCGDCGRTSREEMVTE